MYCIHNYSSINQIAIDRLGFGIVIPIFCPETASYAPKQTRTVVLVEQQNSVSAHSCCGAARPRSLDICGNFAGGNDDFTICKWQFCSGG